MKALRKIIWDNQTWVVPIPWVLLKLPQGKYPWVFFTDLSIILFLFLIYYLPCGYHNTSHHVSWNTSRLHCTLKSHLTPVNLYFVLTQLLINIAHVSLVFPTYVQFCTHIVVMNCCLPINLPIFCLPQNVGPHAHQQSYSLLPSHQQATELNGIWQHQSLPNEVAVLSTINRSEYYSIGLHNYLIYNLFIIKRSDKYHSRNVMNQNWSFNDYMRTFYCKLINQSN